MYVIFLAGLTYFDLPHPNVSSSSLLNVICFSVSDYPSLELNKKTVETLQMNIGLYCNQACSHCHVESSPKRKQENMSRETAERCISLLSKTPSIHTVDITGTYGSIKYSRFDRHFDSNLIIDFIQVVLPNFALNFVTLLKQPRDKIKLSSIGVT